MSKLMSLLFETNAFKVAEENNPFWYTSGKIGPFFINAQYLYGGEKDSADLLDFIDQELENEAKTDIPEHIFQRVLNQYNTNEIYKYVIDEMKKYIEETINVDEIDYISGGERRDWYFSNILAYLLNKPHLTIYKDLTAVESTPDFSSSKEVSKIEGKNFLHAADLLNQGASFERSWVPAITNLGSAIKWSLFAVDRKQVGTDLLEGMGIKVLSLITLDDSLFTTAKDLGLINDSQLTVLRNYKADQDGSMKKFLIEHPEFIENSLKSDNSKTAKRAKLLVDQDIYGLGLNK